MPSVFTTVDYVLGLYLSVPKGVQGRKSGRFMMDEYIVPVSNNVQVVVLVKITFKQMPGSRFSQKEQCIIMWSSALFNVAVGERIQC